MVESIAGLLPAAGSGERLGRGPKAFVELAGRPLLVWAVAALAAWVDELAVAVPEDRIEDARSLLTPHIPSARLRVVAGGATRQATVARLLASVSAELVVVHDAARPFLDAVTVRAVIAAARATGACSVGLPVADSLVRVEDGAPVARGGLRAVQTPQAFRRALLERAHAAAERDGVAATDDAGLVWRLGYPVTWVDGGAHLFKVTDAADLALAEAFARGRAPDERVPDGGAT